MALDRQKPYGKLSASEIRKAGEASRRNSIKRIDGGQSLGGLNLSTGTIPTTIPDDYFYAELTSSSEPYSFKEIWRPSGTWEDKDGGIVDSDSLYLFEGSGASGDRVLARKMPGNPEEYLGLKFGIGTSRDTVFSACKVMDECTGTYMIGINLTIQKADNTFECFSVPVCDNPSGCNDIWYCIDGVPTAIPIADAPPTEGEIVGPFRTEEEALAACPSQDVTICLEECEVIFKDRLNFTVVNSTVTGGASFVTNGTVTSTYIAPIPTVNDGHWEGSRTVNLGGETITLTFDCAIFCTESGVILSVSLSVIASGATNTSGQWCTSAEASGWAPGVDCPSTFTGNTGSLVTQTFPCNTTQEFGASAFLCSVTYVRNGQTETFDVWLGDE